jgi:TIR domain
MTGSKSPPFLKVVEKTSQPKPVDEGDFRVASWQQTLFAGSLSNLILFVHFEAVSESDFLAAILNSKPKYIVDLRVAPRFDLGTLNRRLVFSVFQQVGAQYYDVAGKLGVRSPRDPKLNPSHLLEELRTIVFRGKQLVDGPIAFIVGDQQADEGYEALLASKMDVLSEKGWELFRVPHVIPEKKRDQFRDVVFISHAAPENNDFARWLGAHLSSLGYKVWSDVTRLIGGEEFWEDIEEAIREHSVKVVVCLSRIAQTKKGVLDEIACAIGTERSRGLENFVIPIRLDDLPFSDVRANIGRKNIIDFSANWASGLAELVKALDRDGVPRPVEDGPGAVALMARLWRRSTATITDQPEPVFANWFHIVTLPDAITFVAFDGPIHEESSIRKLIKRPSFAYLRLIGSFARPHEIQKFVPPAVRIQHRCTISTSTFLLGHTTELPGFSAKDARNQVTNLLRQGWDNRARELGLLANRTGTGSNTWYLPKGLIANDVFQFVGPDGSKRRKSLVGWSEKRKVYWHFGTEAIPVMTGSQHFILRPHVVFTEDGRTPIQSDTRMHVLRRGFCKSWWNDRWRDLIAAFAAWFAQGEEKIRIEMSDNAFVHVDAHMMKLMSPVGLVSSETSTVIKGIDFAEPDWTDDPELDESEIPANEDSLAASDSEESTADDDR